MTAAEFRRRMGLPPPGHDNQNHHHRVSRPKPQRQPSPALEGSDEGQGGGETRALLRITSHRVHLLDPDNHTGGCKHLIDCIKDAGLIEDDSPKHILLVTDQIKVAHFHEEYIEIEITKL